MKKKLILIVCLNLMMLTSGCSFIDIMIQSVSTKTSISLEIAKVYRDYAIAYPIGRVMRSIDPSEPIIIPHKQEDAYPMEFGYVPDVLIYPENPDEPLSGYIYSIENNYLDVLAIKDFDDSTLQVGDQLTVTFDEGNMKLENNMIIAKGIDVRSVDDMDFNELDLSKYIGTSYEAYEDDIICNDLSIYSLITLLTEYGTVTCKEGPNEQEGFKGYEMIVSVIFDDGTYADISVHQYASHEEMEIDAANMKVGKYNGREFVTSMYHFKLGKIIFSVIEKLDESDNNSNKLMVICQKLAGSPFATNADAYYYSEEYRNYVKERK